MSFLKKYKLGTKIAIGFGAVIILMMLSILLGYLGLNKNSEHFSHYRKIAKNNILAGRIQENLLDSQIAFKNFIVTGESSSQKEFEQRFKQLEVLIYDAKNNITNLERSKKINFILEDAKDYKEGFKKIADYQEKRNMIVLDVLTIKGMEMEKNLAELMKVSFEEKNEAALYSIGETQRHFLSARLYVGKYLENNDNNFATSAINEFSEMEKWLKNLNEEFSGENGLELFRLVKVDKGLYIDKFLEVVSIINSRNELITSLNEIEKEIADNSEEIILSIIDEQQIFGPKVNATNENAIYEMLSISLVAIVLSVLISIWIIRIVVFPVKTVTNTFKGISEGEADLNVRLKVNSNDEIGEMSNHFNKFVEKLNTIMNESEKQNWLKTGQSELNEKIRGEQDIIGLGRNIITYLANHLDAQVGALYVKTDTNHFKMISSYAYKKRKNLFNEIEVGEGLVGQSVLEKQMIVITNVPDDYITVNSGLGESTPNNIVVAPCLYNDEVKCIIELGSFKDYTDVELEFIEEICEIIAISINSAQTRLKMQDLLQKSLKQTEELQLQQEELRQTNEELEEQTQALKESEGRLQEQQEELRVINEELEERTKSLEKQKEEINKKNTFLEMAQIEIEQKAQDLERANKYKSQFLANMSHELRTPLNSILILSKLLSEKQDNTPLTQKELDFAKTIHSSGIDLLKLINDILDLSKVESGKMDINLENVNIRDIVNDIEQSFRQIAINKGLRFSIDVFEGLPKNFYTDSQKVKQIIKNLLSNAFKFTEQGEVSVKVDRPVLEEMLDSSIEHKNAIKISVTDSGIGIPNDKKELIFEAFKQSDGTISRKYGGTGLGLFISKELTHLLGGQIYLTSEYGKGSTFAIIIPERLVDGQENNKSLIACTQEDLNRVEEKRDQILKEQAVVSVVRDNLKEDSTKSILEDKTLLIIEDDPEFAQMLFDLAQEKGFKCLIANDGETGIQLAINFRPKAIILDIGLPDINGWEVIEKLKEIPNTSKIPVHVISGYENNIDEMTSGIIGYLTKPVSIDKLNDMFQNIDVSNGKSFKKVLIVEDNNDQRFSITEFISKTGILTKAVASGEETYELLKKESFDCMILDLGLKDMSGFDLLDKLKTENLLDIPVIIYTGKDLLPEEDAELQKYAETIIIKGPQSMERLMAEATLFLHSVNSKISDDKCKIVKMDYEKENVLSGKKILIVDDDMRNVFALTSVLEEKSIEVIVGRNGKEGIQKLIDNPDTDLVLMDIMMPEMDGYTAMREIRKIEKYRKLPIIALTAKAMKEDRNKCIGAGASDYLIKPVDTNKLISLLRVWLY